MTAIISLFGFCPFRHNLKINTGLKNKLLRFFAHGSKHPGLYLSDFKNESENFQDTQASGMVFLLKNRIIQVRENKK